MIKLVVDSSVAVKWFIRDIEEEKDLISAVDILIKRWEKQYRTHTTTALDSRNNSGTVTTAT